jgi:hypothetical protein
MPIVRTGLDGSWMRCLAALVAVAMLLALAPQAQLGHLWSSTEAAANPESRGGALERQVGQPGHQKGDLRQASEVRVRPDARPLGPPPQPPATAESPTTDFPWAVRPAAAIGGDQAAAGAPASPFHGRAPPLT